LRSFDLITKRLVAGFGYGIAVVILCYFIAFAYANPSPELILAIAFEVGVFAFILFFRWSAARRPATKLKNLVIAELGTQFDSLGWLFRIGRTSVALVLGAAFAFLLADFAALSAAAFGAHNLSRAIYVSMPTHEIFGCHPALSLEIFSGAFIEAGKFTNADILTRDLFLIRKDLYGNEHQMIASIYTDMGGLYRREGKLAESEACYRKALVIGKKVLGDTGYGSTLTKLAVTLKERGKFSEANQCLQEALSMREQQFGKNHPKVAHTLYEMSTLLPLIGHASEANAARVRANQIMDTYNRGLSGNNSSWLIVACALSSCLVSYVLFGRNGMLTATVIKHLEKKIAAAGAAASPKDIDNLNALYKLQKKSSKRERFSLRKREHREFAAIADINSDCLPLYRS
jgi:tetratricopeptide (TPR) repeat protein